MSKPHRDIRCWRCGAALDIDFSRMRREEVCPACDADLHACKLCEFYNTAVSEACDEPIATIVSNKERANFCDYFKPKSGAFGGAISTPISAARAELDALFGGAAVVPRETADVSSNQSELERLFGLNKDADKDA